MADNLSDKLADEILFQDLHVQRFEGDLNRRMAAYLQGLQDAALDILRSRRLDPTLVVQETAAWKRIELLGAEIDKEARSVYRKINREVAGDLSETAQIVGRATIKAVNGTSGLKLFSGGINKAAANRIAEQTVVGDGTRGAVMRDWWDANAQGFRDEFVRRIKQGVSQDATLTELTTRITGTELTGRRGSVVVKSLRQAETLARTGLQAAVNEARHDIYRQNADIVRGEQASNPLDATTSDICRARAGAAWTLDGEPFPGMSGGVGRFPGPPPWHWGCRTVLIPIIRKLSELRSLKGREGRRLRKEIYGLQREKQVALDGRPARGLTFEGWLRKRSADEQRKILGPGKYDLWKADKLAMRDLIDQTGRPMPLKELRAIFD